MNKLKIRAFTVIAILLVGSAVFFTNASGPVYNFLDFLPLNMQMSGQFYVAKNPSVIWVINADYGEPNDTKTQIQFKQVATQDVWISDIWQYNKPGPFGWEWAYLLSQGARIKDSNGNYSDVEYKIKSKKTEIVRYVGSQVVTNVIDYTSTTGVPGIPYARMSWTNYPGVGLKYVVKNSYIIENANGEPAFLVYHEQEFIHNVGSLIEGPVWAGAAPSSREYLLLSEAYWQYYIKDPLYYENNPDKDPWEIGGLEPKDNNPAQMEIFDVSGYGKYAWPSSNSAVKYGRSRYHAMKTGNQSGIMGFRVNSQNKEGVPVTYGTKFTSDIFATPQ